MVPAGMRSLALRAHMSFFPAGVIECDIVTIAVSSSSDLTDSRAGETGVDDESPSPPG
jgi:hypothetical protein